MPRSIYLSREEEELLNKLGITNLSDFVRKKIHEEASNIDKIVSSIDELDTEINRMISKLKSEFETRILSIRSEYEVKIKQAEDAKKRLKELRDKLFMISAVREAMNNLKIEYNDDGSLTEDTYRRIREIQDIASKFGIDVSSYKIIKMKEGIEDEIEG